MQTVSITITKKVTILLYIVTGQIFKAIFLPLGGKSHRKAQALKYHLLPWIQVFLIQWNPTTDWLCN